MNGPPSRRQVTISDVATAAGVSRQTVSNALNAPDRLQDGTLARVRQTIDLLDYQPHRQARNFKAQRTGLIGCRVARKPTPVLDRFLHALATAAVANDYQLLVVAVGEASDELACYRELLGTRTVDGLVLSDLNYDDPRVAYLRDRDMPFVAFGRCGDEATWVDVDGVAGTRMAVRHLLASGHRRVAFVGWPDGSRTGDQRAAGYRQGLAEAGIDIDERLIVRGLDGPGTGARALAELLNVSPRPTAVVTASDLLALGVMTAAQTTGLQVGPGVTAEGIAVVGFDNTPVAALASPSLTSLHQPLEQAGSEIMRLLSERIAFPDAPATGVLLEPTLIARSSA